MKKLLALCMVIAMLLGLALTGCSSGDSAQADPTEETAEQTAEEQNTEEQDADEGEAASDRVSDVKARLEAGEEVLIGYAVNTLSNPALKQTVDNVTGFFEEIGCTVSVAACEGDTALMISQVENFIEMNVDLIIVAPIDQDAMEDTLMKAVDAGIPVIFNGQYPSYADQMSGGGATDYTELGKQNAYAALAWVDQTYPDAGEGEIHVAVLGYNNTYIFKQIYDAMIEVLEEDSRIVISYTGEEHNSIDLGYSAAEEALTMDSDIRLFLCYQDSPGIGVANYLMSRSDLDMDEFGVFDASYSDTSQQMVDDEENPTRSILYYGVYNSDDDIIMGYNIFYAAKAILLGEKEAPFWILDDIWSSDSFGFDLLIDNPENNEIYG
ncbi:MAG: substrate-binding domain-containing protein [Oscillospiraceae bacterium]|nr:substrate-binding domain-containing protein [Oscillospiraceae bacterium]